MSPAALIHPPLDFSQVLRRSDTIFRLSGCVCSGPLWRAFGYAVVGERQLKNSIPTERHLAFCPSQISFTAGIPQPTPAIAASDPPLHIPFHRFVKRVNEHGATTSASGRDGVRSSQAPTSIRPLCHHPQLLSCSCLKIPCSPDYPNLHGAFILPQSFPRTMLAL